MAPSSPTSNSEDEFLDEGLHDHILLEHFPSDPIPPSASRSPSPPKAVLSSQSSEAPLEEAPVSQEWVNLDEEASDEAWQIALLQSLQTTESNRPNPSNPPSEHESTHPITPSRETKRPQEVIELTYEDLLGARGTAKRSRRSNCPVEPIYLQGKILKTPLIVDGTVNASPASALHTGIISIPQIVSPGATRALVTTFVVDPPWLLPQLPKDMPLTIVRHWSPKEGEKAGVTFLSDYLSIYHPPLPKDEAFCSLHGKLWIIEYPGFIRIAIGSGNLLALDWEILENVIFIQDFPRRSSSPGSDTLLKHSPFQCDIQDYLTALQVPKALVPTLQDFDYSKAKVHVVASVHGSYEMHEEKWGIGKLASITKKWAIPPSPKGCLTCQTSSLGSMDEIWLRFLWNVSQGRSLIQARTLAMDESTVANVQILFPSESAIQKDPLEGAGAHSFFLSTDMYARYNWPKRALHEGVSSRGRSLMHTKMILADLREAMDTSSDPEEVVGWVYLGSHNLTKAAWGHMRGFKRPSMMCNNYEIGIVLPIRRKDTSGSDAAWIPDWLPIPWDHPPSPYPPGEIPCLRHKSVFRKG